MKIIKLSKKEFANMTNISEDFEKESEPMLFQGDILNLLKNLRPIRTINFCFPTL